MTVTVLLPIVTLPVRDAVDALLSIENPIVAGPVPVVAEVICSHDDATDALHPQLPPVATDTELELADGPTAMDTRERS